ncbi:hypothetical protein DXG01_001388 [Tephrocybe rancida]|nr:hypothetical protein DXG01_001388 [Tephrocybe rancida]
MRSSFGIPSFSDSPGTMASRPSFLPPIHHHPNTSTDQIAPQPLPDDPNASFGPQAFQTAPGQWPPTHSPPPKHFTILGELDLLLNHCVNLHGTPQQQQQPAVGGQLFTPGLVGEQQGLGQPTYYQLGQEPEYINGPTYGQQPQPAYGQAPVDQLAGQFGRMGMGRGQKQFQLNTTNLLTSPPEPCELYRPPPEICLPPNLCISPSPYHYHNVPDTRLLARLYPTSSSASTLTTNSWPQEPLALSPPSIISDADFQVSFSLDYATQPLLNASEVKSKPVKSYNIKCEAPCAKHLSFVISEPLTSANRTHQHLHINSHAPFDHGVPTAIRTSTIKSIEPANTVLTPIAIIDDVKRDFCPPTTTTVPLLGEASSRSSFGLPLVSADLENSSIAHYEPPGLKHRDSTIKTSTDNSGFYSWPHNEDLIERLQASTPGLATLEASFSV